MPEIFDRVVLVDVEVACRVDRGRMRRAARTARACGRGSGCRSAPGSAPLPSSVMRQRDLRLRRPPIDYRAAHRTSSIAAMHAARVLDDAGADADAAGATRLGRPVAQVDAALARRRSRASAVRSPARDQHEIRAALPVGQSEPVARGIQQRFRLGDLTEVIGARTLDRRAPPARRRRRRC